jgi:purine-binding chemotaxis protein CheW
VSHQYCTFMLDGHLFGVPVASVQEVLKQQDVTPVPLAPREVSGLINLRGQIVTTLDLRTRLGLPVRDEHSSSVSVVVRAADGGVVSLVVDQIGDVLEAEEGLLEPPPDTVPADVRELVMGICKLDDRLMLLLDTERAVAVTEPAA